MDTITFGQSTFRCSTPCIATPPHAATTGTMSWEPTTMALPADYYFAVYADGQHVGDLHDARLKGRTLRGRFVHA